MPTKTNVKKTSQYAPKVNYPQNKMVNIPKNQNTQIYQYNMPKYNVQKTNITNKNYINKQIIKKGGNPVFNTQGQIIDESGSIVQYSMINGDKFIIGLENRSNNIFKLQLILEGLIINSTGKNYAIFYSNPKERKIFTTSILPNYNYDQIAFEFQYA